MEFVRTNHLCSDEINWIQEYTSFRYGVWNKPLREDRIEDELGGDRELANMCIVINALKKIKKFPGPVYRGFSLPQSVASQYLKEGEVILEKSFLSTDKKKDIAVQFSLKNSNASNIRILK